VADDLRTLAVEALWANSCRGGRSLTHRDTVDVVLAAVLPAHRAQVLDEAADALLYHDLPGQTTEWGRTARQWFDRAAKVVRRLAATGPTATPASTLPAQHAPAVPQETERQSYGCDDCDRLCAEKCDCTGCTAPDTTKERPDA